MATTGTENHCRLCLILMKGGTKASERLFLKRVEELSPEGHEPFPWTVDDFLQSKQEEIKRSNILKSSYQVLFPRTGDTDLTKWDLNLFCNVLITFCDLEQIPLEDVKLLRKRRNFLCHLNVPNVDQKQYKSLFKTIETSINRVLDETGDQETKKEVDKIIADIDNGPLSLVDALKGMQDFYSMEIDLQEKLKDLQGGIESILQRIEKIEKHLEHQPASRIIVLPGIEIFIELKNLLGESEVNISSELVKSFEEVIRREDEGFHTSIPPDTYTKLQEAVCKTFKLFLSKGWRITSTRNKCIQLHIRCNTFAALASLFREYVSGSITSQLKDLREAISLMEDGENVELETVIYKDAFWKVIDKSVSTYEDVLSEDNDIDPLLIENLQLCDSDTPHNVSITARRASKEETQQVEGEVESGLQACLRLMEKEIRNEFDEPNVFLQASYTVKQSLNSCPTPAVNGAVTERAKQIYDESSILSEPNTPDTLAESSDRGEPQAIALVEIYRAQRAIAKFLELSSLYLAEHTEITEKVLSAARRAKDLQKRSIGPRYYEHLHWISAYIHFPDEAEPYTYRILRKTENIQEETENYRNAYAELQSSVKEIIEFCDTVENMTRRQLTEEPTIDVKLMNFIKHAHEELEIAQQKTDAVKKFRANLERESTPVSTERMHTTKMADKEEAVKTSSDDMMETIETTTLSLLQPGQALTGGIDARKWKDRSLGDIFKMFRSEPGNDHKIELLMEAYQAKVENRNKTDKQPLVVDRMYEQGKDALDRLETIDHLAGEFKGKECLREVYAQLKYIEVQLARQIDCFSDMIASVKVFISQRALFPSRDDDIYRRMYEEWLNVKEIYLKYRNVSDRQLESLYSFASFPETTTSSNRHRQRHRSMLCVYLCFTSFPENTTSSNRQRRRSMQLVREIKKEIFQTYPMKVSNNENGKKENSRTEEV